MPKSPLFLSQQSREGGIGAQDFSQGFGSLGGDVVVSKAVENR